MLLTASWFLSPDLPTLDSPWLLQVLVTLSPFSLHELMSFLFLDSEKVLNNKNYRGLDEQALYCHCSQRPSFKWRMKNILDGFKVSPVSPKPAHKECNSYKFPQFRGRFRIQFEAKLRGGSTKANKKMCPSPSPPPPRFHQEFQITCFVPGTKHTMVAYGHCLQRY